MASSSAHSYQAKLDTKCTFSKHNEVIFLREHFLLWRVFGKAEITVQFLDSTFGQAICVFHTDQQVQTKKTGRFLFKMNVLQAKWGLILIKEMPECMLVALRLNHREKDLNKVYVLLLLFLFICITCVYKRNCINKDVRSSH